MALIQGNNLAVVYRDLAKNAGMVELYLTRGDDSIINIQDIIISVNHAITGSMPEPHLLWAVDMNYDNILNILDVVKILNIILS